MIVSEVRTSRGTVFAAFVAMGCGLVSLAGFELILVPLQTDLMFSVDNANALVFMPAAASLVVVFLAGSMADRWGPRRPLVLAALLFISGSVLISSAPGLPWVVLGRILDGVGGVTLSIVGLSLLNASAVDPKKRARLFGMYAAIAPAMFILSPSLSALITENASWRWGAVPWAVLGIVSLVVTIRFVPSQGRAGATEWITPLLAGLTLAGLALGVLNANTNPSLSIGAFAVGVVSLAVVIPVLRRTATPSLNIAWLRGRGMTVLLVALAVASMPNLFFYTKLLLQYRYTVPLIEIALLMAIPQMCALAGGLASGPVSARFGAERAAIGALFVSAVACLGLLIITADAPIWVPVAALSVSAFPIAFVVGPMTNVLLGRAPKEASGSASSMRKATWTLGGVLGGALVGYVLFGAFETRLSSLLVARGEPLAQASDLARAIRDGAVVDELVLHSADLIAREALFDKGPDLLQAQSHTVVVMGVLSAAIYLIAALLMVVYLRRSSDRLRSSER